MKIYDKPLEENDFSFQENCKNLPAMIKMS